MSDSTLTHRRAASQRLLTLLAGVLIVKVTIAVIVGYRNYFPPDFTSDFLRGRESYFANSYRWAFYAHIASGPISLFAGLVLLSDSFRRHFAAWHRRLGRIQVACVLLVVAPSGLWMAYYASPGPIAGMSFATLSLATAGCIALGWRAAVRRRFVAHRRWMLRCFVLLCSAVVLRVAGGLATVLAVESPWFDPIASWACWIVPMAVLELTTRMPRRRAPALS